MDTAKHFLNKANVLNSFLDQISLSVGNQLLSSNSETLFDKLSMFSFLKNVILSYSTSSNIKELSEWYTQEFFQIEYFIAWLNFSVLKNISRNEV